MEAMTRRSLAFGVVGLISFDVFQKWIQHLFQIMRQPAPPGFKQPTITQLMRADRQAFVRMQELTRDGIKPKPDGTRPLDAVLALMPNDHTVMYYMLPTQTPTPQPKAKAKPEAKKEWAGWDGSNKTSHKPSKKVWKTGKNPKQGPYPSGGKLPLALKGCASCLPDGSRLCFGYNISGCDKAALPWPPSRA